MKIANKKSIFDDLNKYCYMAKEDSFIEITEWTNGEGYDVNIGSSGDNKLFSLTHGELEAINYLIKSLEYQNNEKL